MALKNVSAVPKTGRASFWIRSRDTRTAYMYILPAVVVMAVITLFPLGFQVYMSFTDYGLKNLRYDSPPANWVGLDNYLHILNGDTIKNVLPSFDFFGTLTFNIWWALSNVVFHVVLGVLIAVLLNVEGLWFKRIYRAVYILPVVIPAIIIATVWKKIFDTDSGVFNILLGFLLGPLGLAKNVNGVSIINIPWLDNSQGDFLWLPLAYYALLIANIWLGWPLNSVVATGALQSIPKDLYEAATVDGASGSQQFFNITVPMLRVAMIPFAVFGFITTFNLFHLSYFMSEGRPFGRTELLVTQAFKLVNNVQLYGIGAAFAIYMFFILLTITLITTKITKATATID
jgi:arabinogalactan oligomer/maltooligosaccharide transport system permease protein